MMDKFTSKELRTQTQKSERISLLVSPQIQKEQFSTLKELNPIIKDCSRIFEYDKKDLFQSFEQLS